MVADGQQAEESQARTPVFATTHWSVVLAAGQQESPQASQALERLCRAYWYPLYVYVRRRGYGAEDAQDLTQEFFARFLAKDYFRLADPARGRFRTFLLNALQHFLINEWKQAQRVRRTGVLPGAWLDVEGAERRCASEPVDALTPDRAYEKRWAASLLDRVLAQLCEEYANAGKGGLFEALKQFLWGRDGSVSYAEVGRQLGLSENAMGVAVHRLRQRYREQLRAEVAQTVATPEDVDAELRDLIRIVSQVD